METLKNNREKIYHIIKVLVFVLIIICAVRFLTEGNSFDRNGNKTGNTISFTGHGEISAVSDIANISFSISQDAKTVKEAQDSVAQIEKKSLDFLKTSNVADADIKTTNASFYPKYENQIQAPCTQYGCPPSRSVVVGYTASENISVKIRKVDDAGKIIQGLGTLGVSNLDGPNFAIDKEDDFKNTARKLAIDDAKTKAKELAKELGVRLGKIASFNENGNYPMPMYNAKAMTADSAIAPAPAELPKGENLITSDVTIVYEIR